MHWPNKSQCGYGYEHLSSISDNRNVAIYIEMCNNTIYNMICRYLQGESKKSGISKIMGITSFKYIRKGHIGGVLENSGYLLPDGH